MIQRVNDPVTTSNRLRPVVLRLARLLRREIHPLGVTGGQVSLLVAIKRSPGTTARDLAEAERVSAPAMSAHLVRLEAANLIGRTRAIDRRRVGLTLTEEGERVLRSVKKRRTAWLAGRLRGLSDDELARIEAAIEPLEKLLGDAE